MSDLGSYWCALRIITCTASVDLHLLSGKHKVVGNVAPLVECLPSIQQALDSLPSSAKIRCSGTLLESQPWGGGNKRTRSSRSSVDSSKFETIRNLPQKVEIRKACIHKVLFASSVRAHGYCETFSLPSELLLPFHFGYSAKFRTSSVKSHHLYKKPNLLGSHN